MKKTTLQTFCIILITSVILLPFGCKTKTETRKKENISVSIFPVKYFVDRLTGETIKVNVMLPAGAGHDTYSPTPQQFQQLSDSKLYFRIGYLGYEQAWIHRLEEINPDMQMINLSEGVDLIRSEAVQHGDHFHDGGVDPHIWMSPKIMKKILPKIKDALILNYPDLEEFINLNYKDLMADVEAMNLAALRMSKNVQKNKFIIFHPALTYFARDYELEQISIEYEGKEPSPVQIASIIKIAKDEKISVIFVQEEYDVRNAQQIAKEAEAEIVHINPMAYDWMNSMDLIIRTLQYQLNSQTPDSEMIKFLKKPRK